MTDAELRRILLEELAKADNVDQATIAALRRVRADTITECAQKLIDAHDYGHSEGMAEIVLQLKTV